MVDVSEYEGPLAGLKVIDFGHYYAGPMAAMLLADQGADVIHIVRPGQLELPEPQFRVLNRGKKLLELDLKTDDGKRQALSLIEKADVVIENFRPGVMKRLGLDYGSVKDGNPGLIYLSLPGFASTDKERAHIQAWEGVMNAAACAFTQTHWWRELANYPPVYTWVPLCSAHGSMQGAIAVMAALMARETTGRGTVIEAPLVAAAVIGYMNNLIGFPRTVGGEKVVPPIFQPYAYSTEDSEQTQFDKLNSLSRLRLIHVLATWYTCADGRDIFFWPNNLGATDRIFKELGIYKQLRSEGIINEGPWVTGLDNNIDSLSPDRAERIASLVKEAVLKKTAEAWETLLGENGVALSVIRTRHEWMTLEPAHQSGIFTTMGDGPSTLAVPGQFVDVTGPNGELISNNFASPKVITATEAENLFQKECGATTSPSDPHPINKGDLLKGLKVLDLTNLVAGPTATNTLAQYGAEVIKADPPRFVHPALISSGMLEVNQGKRSIIMDLTTAPGRDVFRRLVQWADVVVHNSVDGVAERLGVTQAQLQAINPDVIACQFSAHGGLYRGRGGWERRPGFDPNAQAVSGIMTTYGTAEEPHLHGQITCGDIMGGIGGTFAALLAVYQKRKTGGAGEARSSLDRMVNYIQLPHMIMENGNCDWGEAQGQFALGEDYWCRLYQCRDRWIYVETTREQVDSLSQVVLGRSNGDVKAFENAFRKYDHAYWLGKLQEADIGCHLVCKAEDIIAQGMRKVDNAAADETAGPTVELILREDHPSGKPIVNLVPSWVRIGEHQSYKRMTPACRYGGNTREILEELDYTAEQIEELVRLRVAHDYFPAMGSTSYFFQPE